MSVPYYVHTHLYTVRNICIPIQFSTIKLYQTQLDKLALHTIFFNNTKFSTLYGTLTSNIRPIKT